MSSDIADRRWIVDAEVFVVGRRKTSPAVLLQCNAVRSVHEDGWQREAARSVVSDVTGRSLGGCGDQECEERLRGRKMWGVPGLNNAAG